jgi:DNA-binding NarL/FixJ family response regulator
MRLAELGEQSRIVPTLPLKLVIADRSIALLSLTLDGGRDDALVTESPPLIALLHGVFEAAWSRALPLTSGLPPAELLAGLADPATAPTAPVRAAAPPTREQQSILALIGAGLTDEAIATRLGLSVRSLRRRSQRLMADLGAANRFQLGVEAARRGWV